MGEKPVELSDEEKKTWFVKKDMPDMTQRELTKTFASFTIPTQEEGFDEIRYVRAPEDKCASHMKAWMLDLKKTQRAEDLEPSKWFTEKYEEWTTKLKDWRKKHGDARDAARRKASEKREEKTEDKEKADGG